jgi:hypothetical protein
MWRFLYILYDKCGFIPLNADAPAHDLDENNEPYLVMAKKLSVIPGQKEPKG